MNFFKYYNYKKHTRGFTLIELMVATSIFIVIMLLAMSAVINSADAAKQSQALRQAMDNVNFAMDSMSRSLRIGTNYQCVTSGQSAVILNIDRNNAPFKDCGFGTPGGVAVAFMPASSALIPVGGVMYQVYQSASGISTLERCTVTGCIDMTAANVDVQTLKFFVTGSDPADAIQPSIYILMKGVVIVKGIPTSFSIQTMAAQRSSE